jgi:hypothetical protein
VFVLEPYFNLTQRNIEMEQPNVPQSYQPVLPSSTMAIVSLIAGIAGFSFLPVIGSIVALLTGYAARKETRAVPAAVSGDGMATAGIVMGWIGIGLAVVSICCFAFYFLFVVGLAATQGS